MFDCQRVILVLAILAFLAPPALSDWPEFRGPTANGHVSTNSADARHLPLTWSETENIRWKTAIPYRGWSTPVVMEGRVWLTTATEDGHEFFAICLDAESGEILHQVKLFHCDEPEPLGNTVNGYATPSPAIERDRVYVHFGSYGTACLDAKSGKVVWKRDDLPCRHYRGPSSSVVLYDDLVILTFDGADLQYVAALDKQSGETVWKADRDVHWNDQRTTGLSPDAAQRIEDGDHRKAHSTPLVITTPDGAAQLVSPGAKAAFAYDPRSGREIWRIEHDDFSVAPRPIHKDDITYLITGITHPELWAIRAGGTGDLTESDYILWRLKSRVAKTASPILVDGVIYMISDDGIINAVDAERGEPLWSKRIGGRVAASPIHAAGRLYVCNQEGETTVLEPGSRYHELAKNALDNGCMASPAVADGALFLRTTSHLYRIEDMAGQ